ncbi:DUF6247 family protein [Saccharothrix stipae]
MLTQLSDTIDAPWMSDSTARPANPEVAPPSIASVTANNPSPVDRAAPWRWRYRVDVTAAAAHEPSPETARTPEAIRAALLPEERDAFDADCRHALGQAVEQSSLQPVRDVLDHWWRIATVTRHDPAAHRRMLARVDQTLTGQTPPRLRTWDELRTERGL